MHGAPRHTHAMVLHAYTYSSSVHIQQHHGTTIKLQRVCVQSSTFQSRAGAYLAGAIMGGMATAAMLIWLGALPSSDGTGSEGGKLKKVCTTCLHDAPCCSSLRAAAQIHPARKCDGCTMLQYPASVACMRGLNLIVKLSLKELNHSVRPNLQNTVFRSQFSLTRPSSTPLR